MRALIKLFSRSPFAPLQAHMEKVAACVHAVPDLFEALTRQDYEAVEKIANEISTLEHEADLTKNDIRASLKSHLFLPVNRASLLEVLALQDSLADKAEDIGILLGFKRLDLPPVWKSRFAEFLACNLAAFDSVHQVIAELNELLESSFGGAEADKIRTMVDQVAYSEHQVDLLQRELVRELFRSEQELSHGTFYLWMRIIEEVGGISNLSEKLGNRILLTMELR
jgi:uncharacterized protein